MLDLRRPRHLRAGDRVAALTLSWGGPGTYPERYEQGRRQFEEALGVEVVDFPMTCASEDHVAAHPELRAADLHAALTDDAIAGIVATIGGDDSIRLLRHLDLDLLAAHPKPLLGFSDTTVTQMALLRAGVVSFYGPSLLAGFSESGGPHPYAIEGVRRAMFSTDAPGVWPANPDGWTIEMQHWGDTSLLDIPRQLTPPAPWRWLGGEPAEGPAIPACIEVLDWLRGTDWWPDLDGAVLILETSEEEPPPDAVARFLRTLAATGELQRLSGLVLGRPHSPDGPDTLHADYDDALLQVVRTEEGLRELPIVTRVDIGHTAPTWTVPVGTRMRIDPEEHELTFLEAGVT